MRTGPADADVYNKGQAKFDEWLAEHDRALAEKVWSEGHSQAMANVAWPKERKGNPYTKEEA
jgi:hypothetical protein